MHNHVILTLGRSGSNTLTDLLNQNPAVLNYGEVLGDWNRIRKVQRQLRLFQGDDPAYLNAVLRNRSVLRVANLSRSLGKARHRKWSEIKALRNVTSVGFKDFANNFIKLQIPNYLKSASHVKVIGLERTNALDRMISNEFLERTGVIALKKGQTRSKLEKLWIDPDQVLNKLDVIERESNDLRRMLEVLPEERVLRVQYADLYSGPERTTEIVREAYDFLGAPVWTPKVRMRKILKGDPLDALKNGQELREIIGASRFATYLHGAAEQVAARALIEQARLRASLLNA